MRSLPLLCFVACVAFAPTVSAQKAVTAWYEVSSKDDTRTVQAEQVHVVTSRGVSRVVAGRERFELRGAVDIVFFGTGAEPVPPTEPSARGGGSTRETTTTITDADGTVTKTTTVERQDESGDISTVSTTTSTTSPNGDTTTTTVTYEDD